VCTRTLHTSLGYTLPSMDNATVTAPEAPTEDQPELLTEELLVEEISIDGMCGVY
jgi:mycofactocin precursor